MKSIPGRYVALIFGALALFATARAQEGGSDTIVYNPYVKIATGNEPYTLTSQTSSTPPQTVNGYTLSITGPADASSTSPITVTPEFGVVSVPTGADPTTALTYVSCTPTQLTFTQPNQTLTITINAFLPVGAYAGNYEYIIYNVGWTDNDEDDGAYLNIDGLPPLQNLQSPPTVAITQPVSGQYFYYPYSSESSLQSVTIPVTAVGSIPAGGDPVTTVSISAGNTPLSTAITFNDPATGDATGNATFSTSTAGSYTFVATAQNQDGTSDPATVTVQVIAVPPPTITINPPADGSVIYIPIGSTSVQPSFSISGGSQVPITSVSATLSQNGTPIAAFTPAFTGQNTTAVASSGTLPALTAGTYTISATDSNIAGTGTATSTITVVQGVPPAITINQPTNGSQIAIPAGSLTVDVPYTITGTTAVGTISGASASMTVSVLGIATPVVTFLPSFSGVGTAATASASGTVALGAGTYTIQASDTNSIGGSANATAVTFTVSASQSTTAVPSVTITEPTASSFIIPAGSTTTSVAYAFTGTTSGGILDTILTSAQVTLNGTVINPLSLLGLGLLSSINGSGTLANLGPGTYTLTVTDSNGALLSGGGTASATQSFTFTVVQAATPAISITAPANGATLTIAAGQTTLGVQYTITGNTNGTSSTVDNTITSASATLTTSNGNIGSGFTGAFAGVGTATATDSGIVTLSPGSYTLAAQDANGAPGTGTASQSITFKVVQAAAPAISITAPSNGATITIPAGSTAIGVPYAVAGSITGATGTTVDNTLTSASATLTTSGGTIGAGFSGTFSGVGSASASDSGTVTLSAGSYTLSAQDANGAPGTAGTATQSVTFTVVQAATPAISITAPSTGSTVTIPAGQTTVGVPYAITGSTSGGTVDTALTSASATLTTSGGTIGAGFSGNFNGVNSANVSDSGTVTLSAGSYTLAAQDANGAPGTGTASKSITFTVVQAAVPAISITAPGNGATITIPAGSTTIGVPYAIAGSTSGGTADTAITSASATLTASTGTIGAGFSGNFNGVGSANVSDSGTVTLSAGSYTLAAQDANGAPGTGTASQTITFTVVQAAVPAISITAPGNGATIYIQSGSTTASVPYAITGSTNGTSGTVDNTITSASATLTASTGTIGAGFSGNFSNVGTASVADSGTVTLSAGTYTLAAQDSNGAPGATGTASQTITFTVAAAQPPTIAINPPGNGATYPVGSNGTAAVPYAITGNTPSGTAFTSASSGSATLTASSGGSTSGVTQPSFTGYGPSSTTITATGTFNLTPGTYTLAANATNSSGGVATATPVTFTVTATCSAPTVTNVSNFCTSRIYAGNYIWFDSIIDLTGMSTQAGTIQFNNPTIAFTANGSLVTLAAPSAAVTVSSTATTATTTYDAPSNTWLTTVPVGYTGSIFLTGVAYPVNSTLNVSNNAVTWSGSFLGSIQGVSGLWQTSATVYSPFTSTLNSLGVKPVDSRTLSQYHTSDPAGTPENYTACNNGACCSSSGGSGSGSTAIAGLYATGVSGTGSLLAGGSADSHWVVTASSMGSAYLGNAYVDPSPLAGGWVANSSTAQWITAPGGTNIGNGGGNNGLPSSGSTAQTDTYDYTLTFSLPAGATVSSTNITGTLSADDSVLVFVNGAQVTSGVPNATDYEYNTTSSFTLNSNNASFQAGTNTITFRVANENSPTPRNASGLYVQSIGGTSTVPQGQVTITYCASLGGGHSTQSNGNPPTVTPSSPASNASYAYSAGTPASVPVAFTAASPSGSGNITAVSATLNGQAITLSSVSGVNSSATATAGATLSISQAGTYTLVYTGTNAYGNATATVTFTVVQATPPTISITAPQSCAQITIPSGSTTASVPYSFTGGTNYGTITAVTASLGGTSLSPTVTGLNTTSISGSGTLTLAAGTYTLTATDTNIAGSGTAQVTFSVVSGQTGCSGGSDSGSEVLTWLQCNSFNSSYSCSQNNAAKITVTGGTVVPVTFTLNGSSHGWGSGWNGCWDNTCNTSDFVSDTTVVISICEVYSNNTSSTPVIYTYGASGPNPPYYSIGNNQYLLNFPTAAGTNHYEVQVYHPLSTSGSSLQLLGSEDIYTQSSCMPSTGSNGSNFNGTSIAQGRCIWFNSVINVSGISSQECTLWFDTSSINFTLGKTACSVTAPAACIKFDPNCTTATTAYDANANCWVTSVPVGYSGNVFLTGLCYQVPAGFPAGLKPVTWTGCFRGDNGNCNAQWQWAAAVYTQCPTDPNQLGVKACDSTSLSQYQNSDHAGTPENYKSCVTGGACGGGGSNWTGSYSGTISPSISSNCWMGSSVSTSGWGNDNGNGWSNNSNNGGLGNGW